MSRFDEFYSARRVITDIMAKDLIGPLEEEEIIAEPPANYYVMGKLYPPKADSLNIDESRNASIGSETDTYDASLASANMRKPSSMGITCTLKPGVKEVRVDVSFAVYRPQNADEIKEEHPELIESLDEAAAKKKVFWKRQPVEKIYIEEVSDFTEQPADFLSDVTLRGYFHKAYRSEEKIFTVVLVNKTDCEKDLVDINANTLFQAHIRISAENQKDCIFTTVMRQIPLKENPELIEMDMLYDNYRFYGQGHGCSVVWGNTDENELTEPDYISSSFMPMYNLKQMKAARSDNPVFGMKHIISSDSDQVIREIREYADSYREWINGLKEKCRELIPNFQKAGRNNIQNCEDALGRIRHAADLLEGSLHGDQKIWKAFIYTNEAMLTQRIQGEKKKAGNDNAPVNEDKITWYPFQLAFILQEIPSIVEHGSEDRKLVDLLWFPTGGGKTEAYLGIAAFIIFYRRLQNGKRGEGVAVFMRYTLRLLTMQQFERASMLICACELLRRKYSISGDPIEIGLWVGNEAAPKDLNAASQVLEKLHNGIRPSSTEANPLQFRICPWCGSDLTADNYSVDRSRHKMIIRCSNRKCDFHKIGELPVDVTDEEIYERTPAFIVGTVDKFAQILFKENTYRIFGKGTDHNPPDLIIQDEMHLISGPLGTMTGIYEGAITKMCEKGNVPVKIIASTATVRNATGQIKALYGRKFSQFPPQGLDADNSFFAEKADESDRPARLYAGVMGVGTTMVTTLIRVYASWLFASRYLVSLQYKEKPYDDEVIDNFWTLTGYFNSLRELGAARTQIVDDVQSRYRYLKDTKFANLTPAFIGENSYDFSDELTSRKDSEKLTQILQVGLKKQFTRESHSDAYDFIVATNMISVGVDIDRLGVMVVAGQPKTNAEYIQATSRVGRHNPGLVITVFNGARSRARSHYEQFLRYHSAMYRYVEASSLTPFSDRARDRGLQALFVILCRFYIDYLTPDDAAGNFDRDDPAVEKIKNQILDYAEIVDPGAVDDTADELDDIIEEWDNLAQNDPQMKYRTYYSDHSGLLQPDTDVENRFRAMNSMRSVEEQSGIYLL